MKILAHLHGFVGRHNAGAERYVEALLAYMVSKGHTCSVLVPENMGEHGSFIKGIQILTKDFNSEEATQKYYEDYDYILTHLDLTPSIIQRCHKMNKRLIYVVHNQHSIPYWQVKTTDAFCFVWNTQWLKTKHHDLYNFHPPHELVVTPHTNTEEFDTRGFGIERNKITLINLNENKGVKQFIMLAKLLPEYQFLGVKGAYGDQVTRLPANVTVINHTPNIQDIYAQTKVLVVPSKKETWGMVALEAMSSGIPVIAHPTEGLLEALGSNALFALRDKAYVWRDAVKNLMENQDYYDYLSNLALARAAQAEKNSLEELKDLEKFLSLKA